MTPENAFLRKELEGKDKQMDWHRVNMNQDPYVVEWSPVGEENVRIKGRNGEWLYCKARRADEAYVRACELLEKLGEK